MNKTYLTLAGVAVVALVGFGILSQEQGDQAEGVIASLGGSTETFVSDISTAVESGMDSATEVAQELAADAESAADEAFEAASEVTTDAMDSAADAIEPAAGDAEAEADKMMDAMQN